MSQVRSSTGSGGARGHCRVLWRWKKWKSKKRMSVTERSYRAHVERYEGLCWV